VLDTAAVTPVTPSPMPTAINVLNIAFAPPGVMGGGSPTQATVTLNRAAPAGGVVVAVTSEDPAAQVPSTVTIPAGAQSGGFAVTTRSVPTDTQIRISASIAGGGVTGAVPVWAVLPTFLSAWMEGSGTTGVGSFRRFTPQNAQFTGSCSGSDVMIFVDSETLEFNSLQFGAIRGSPLRPGTYEDATRAVFRDATHPGIDISTSAGRTCGLPASGRFVVHEAEFGADRSVRKFWVTFEQHCASIPAVLRGEIRVTDLPAPGSTGSCLR
jgi:hypothetical protein